MKRIIMAFCLFSLLFLTSLRIFGQDSGGFKFLYQVKKDEAKFVNATVQQDTGRLLCWEKGRILAKNITSSSGWRKYMNFTPEDLGVRIEEGKTVRVVEPGLVSGICYSPENKKAAFIMHLDSSVNSVLGVVDFVKDKVIYSNSARIHPPVPERKMNVMAIENINTLPSLSSDGKYVVCAAFTYLYAGNVEVVDIAQRKRSVIPESFLPHIWKDKVFYLKRNAKGTNTLYGALLTDLKGEKIIDVDFELTSTAMNRGVYYVLSGKKIYSCPLEGELKFTLIGDAESLATGYETHEIWRFFVASAGKQDYVYIFARGVIKEKAEFKMYSILAQ